MYDYRTNYQKIADGDMCPAIAAHEIAAELRRCFGSEEQAALRPLMSEQVIHRWFNTHDN